MITKIFGYFIVLLFLFIPVIIYRKCYFFPLTSIHLDKDLIIDFRAVKPSHSFYRTFSLGSSYNYVSLGNGYVALYLSKVSDSSFSYGSSGVRFYSDVYLFRRSRFGRLRSVDLSDRCLIDILSKFKKEV